MKIVFEQSDKQRINSIKKKSLVLGSFALSKLWQVACVTVEEGSQFVKDSHTIIKASDSEIDNLINRSINAYKTK